MATLDLKVLFNGIDKLSGPMKAIIGGSNNLSKAFKQTNLELNGLKDQQNAVNRFRELNTQIGKSTQDFNKYKQSIKELKDQGKLGPLSQEQTKALAGAEAGLKRVKKELIDQKSRLTETTQGIQKYGFSVNELDDQESQLKNKIHLTTMELNKRKSALDNAAGAQQKFARTQAILQKGSDIAKKGMMVAGVGAATLTIPAKLSIDFESSMADIAKVVDGLKDDAGKVTPAYAAMSKEIIAMSSRLPMAANDIATIVAAGGQSGIAANQLTQFAESAVKMGVAFDVSASEAGQSMSELRTAFRLNQTQVVDLADKINYLGNKTPAAAKGIMEIVQRIGPLGEVGGYASGSIAALGATLRGMGVQEEIAATGIKNMMLALVAGESATKAQKGAWSELGMDYAKVSEDMQTNAEGTTLAVLQSISQLDKYKQASVLGELFGKESLSAIAPLLTNMKSLQTNLDMVADKTKYAGSMEKEYAARAATTANNLQLLKNKVSGVAITIGNNLLPAINSGVTAFSNIISRVQTWADANPTLASTLTKVAVGAIAIVGAISALSLGVIAVLGPIAMLKMTLATIGGGAGLVAGALKMMIAPIKMVGAAFLWVGRAMLANPMVLAITAVVAIVAGAAYLIYKNWTPIKGFFSNLWEVVKGAFNTGVNFIKGIIQSVDAVFANNPILNLLIPIIGVPRLIIANWSSISAFFTGVWQAIGGAVSTGVSAVFGFVSSGFNSILNTASMIWGSIKGVVSSAWTGLCNLIMTYSPLGFVMGHFNNILAFLGGIATKMMSIGKNIIDGLIDGIKSGFERLKSIWNTINSYMPDFMRKRMEIRSPSRVMRGLGGHIVDGIGVGVANRTPDLKNQFSKTLGVFDTGAPASTFDSSSKFSTPSFKDVQPVKSRNLSYQSNDQITINVHAPANSPLHQAAKQVREELEERDRKKQEIIRRWLKDQE